ncbi:MAG: M16 family metallopeptidase [Desulfomonilaceae bacterium]
MTRHTLKNGLEVLIQEDHARKIAAAELWVTVGSADEESSERGISHLIEHMAFKGTARRGVGQIAKEIEALGGEINAYTSWDETVFHIAAPSTEIANILDILVDAVFNPALDSEELNREKQVILEEILETEERPERKSSQLIFSTAFVTSPYKYPVIGVKDIVEKFTREDVVAFREKWYVPSNMFLVVSGDVNTSEVLQEVEKLTADLRPVGFFRPPRAMELSQKDIRSSLITDKNARETRLNIAFHVPQASSIDTNPLDLAADILGGRESSRLIKSLKMEKRLVHSISVACLTPKEPGLLVISATLDSSNLEAATLGIMEEISRLANEHPSLAELERAKVHIESQHVYSYETVQGIARGIGTSKADAGDPNFEDKYLVLNRAVTPDEVSEVVRIYMRALSSTITVLAPEDNSKDCKIDSLTQIIRSFAPVLKVATETPSREPQTTLTQLSNGIRVLLTPDNSNPAVSIKIVHLGGKRFETEENQGIMNFVADMSTKGVEGVSEDEILRIVEEMGGRLAGFSGYDSFGVSLTIFSRHLEKGLNLISTIHNHPTFPEKEMERERQLIINRIKTKPDRPVEFALNCLNKALYKIHPYGFDTEGTPATVAKFTRMDLMDCYRKYSVPANTIIAIVGEFDQEKALKILDNLFGNVPASPFEPPKVPIESPVDHPWEQIVRIPRAKAHIAMGFQTVSMLEKDRYPLEVLNNLLGGQGGRLFFELRDKQSLAYSVASFMRPSLDKGAFGFYMACEASKVDRAFSGLLGEIEKVRSNSASDKEIKNALSNLIGNHAIRLQSTWSRAENMSLNTLYGLGWNYETEYVKKISEVKPEDVLRVAKKYLDPQKLVVVKIIPDSYVK